MNQSIAAPTAMGASVGAGAVKTKANRISIFDGVRGYLLTMMYMAHFHFEMRNPVFGIVHHGNYSPVMDAEFFILISGFVCALAYHGVYLRGGAGAAAGAVAGRLKWVYLYQIVFALVTIYLFRAFGDVQVLWGYKTDYDTPFLTLLWKAIRFVLQPPYLNILMLYIVLMAFIPLASWAIAGRRFMLFWGVLIGMWLFANSGLDLLIHRAIEDQGLIYRKHLQLMGYFQPLSYALVFYGGFYIGVIVKTGEQLPGRQLLQRNRNLFIASVAVLALFLVICVVYHNLPRGWYEHSPVDWMKDKEWQRRAAEFSNLAKPDRRSITLHGLIVTLAASYAVFYLIASQGAKTLAGRVGGVLKGLFNLPFLVLLGQSSLFVYSIHAATMFCMVYILKFTGWDASVAMRIGFLIAGYLIILGLAFLKRKFLPRLP